MCERATVYSKTKISSKQTSEERARMWYIAVHWEHHSRWCCQHCFSHHRSFCMHKTFQTVVCVLFCLALSLSLVSRVRSCITLRRQEKNNEMKLHSTQTTHWPGSHSEQQKNREVKRQTVDRLSAVHVSIMVSMRLRCVRGGTEWAIIFVFRSFDFFLHSFVLGKWHGRCVIVGSPCTRALSHMCWQRRTRTCAWCENRNAVHAETERHRPYGQRCNRTEIRESIFNYTHYVRWSFVSSSTWRFVQTLSSACSPIHATHPFPFRHYL